MVEGDDRRARFRVILLGPPGSGKGTQGEVLSKKFDVPQISTGDMLRSAIAAGSELGKKVQDIMSAGALVDDETMLEVVTERLGQADTARGFLLDGYPRTLPQARSLDRILGNIGGGIDHVLLVEVPEEELVRRMVARGRVDDTLEVARDRQRIYRETTEPLVEYYGERGLVRRIAGFQPISDVTRQMIVALEGVDGEDGAR
ncbi:MAG TPA: adenylate kinase [Thermoanaerobaculia bacterium]|nr:adenylate kinase [Thermoanaerobaculia bacterium]